MQNKLDAIDTKSTVLHIKINTSFDLSTREVTNITNRLLIMFHG